MLAMKAPLLLSKSFWLMAACLCAAVLANGLETVAPSSAPVVVLDEPQFPIVDSAASTEADLRASFPGAAFLNVGQLSAALALNSTRLLVISGSAFPEQAWPAIYAYLQRGGNLLALGGRPFSQAAYFENGTWRLRPPRNAFAKALFINDYTETPGSDGLSFQTNTDFIVLPQFAWRRTWSLTVKLSAEDQYPRQGSAGNLDATLHALAWGAAQRHRLSAPVIELDHYQNQFVGGRWEIVAADLEPDFLGSAAGRKLAALLTARALEGANDFSIRPHWALFLPGEPPNFQFTRRSVAQTPLPIHLDLVVSSDRGSSMERSFDLQPGRYPWITELNLPPVRENGFHTVVARLTENGVQRSVYRTGFWIRDREFLNSGPRVTINNDFFEVDGRPVPILGSTYMASDVQRDYFMAPNPYIWEQDFADMQRNGVNMVRTGWWTGWDQVMKVDSVMQEDALRSIEALLMTARRHNMPVQFTFFAFLPEVFGGANPYLDPEALRRETNFVAAVAQRFKDIPWLMWDLINEPSFDKPEHAWATRANGDSHERTIWNDWLHRRYGDNGSIAAAWNETLPVTGLIPAPSEEDFNPQSFSHGGHPLRVHDFYIFAQEQFSSWVALLRDAIRATGSKQLITVGQDEGGGTDRLNPSFWGENADYTTNHTWWLNDALLWDSLVARYPGKPLLIQETGLQNDFNLDDIWRRSAQQQADLLERKLAIATATSAGAIEWLWNVNAYMTLDQEVTIGMVRPDGTDKPEVARFRSLAEFITQNRDHFRSPIQPSVAVVTSQAFQYSALNPLAVKAQQVAVRILHNYLAVPAYVVAENQISRLGNPRLAILPSPEALNENTWRALLAYVQAGGTLLITGSMERDPHWVTTHRLDALGVKAERIDLNYRQATIHARESRIPVSFAEQKWLDALEFPDGSSWKEVPFGQGKLLIAAYPVELAEGNESAAAVYSLALRSTSVTPAYTARSATPGVLIRPQVFADSVLYLFMSESGSTEEIDVTDRLTGAHIKFELPAQRARLLLLSRNNGDVLARWGF